MSTNNDSIFGSLLLMIWPHSKPASVAATQNVTQTASGDRSQTVSAIGENAQAAAGSIHNIYNIGTAPKFEVTQWEHSEIPQGHGYRAILTVRSQSDVPRVKVVVYAPSIQAFEVKPYPIGGIHAEGGTHYGDGYGETTLFKASGDYLVKVITSNAEEPKIGAESV